MDSEQFTEGVARAVVEASSSCLSNKNPEVCPVHLALLMLNDKQGLPARIVSRARCDLAAVERSLEIPLSKLSVQDPTPITTIDFSQSFYFIGGSIKFFEINATHLAAM